MAGIGQGLLGLGKAIGGSVSAHPGKWGLGLGLGGAVGLPWAYRKLRGMSPEHALKHEPGAQLAGLEPTDAKNLQSILIAAGMRRRQLQNVTDFMNEMMTPGYGAGRQ